MTELIFIGDIMIGRSFNDVFKHYSLDYIWGNTLNYLKQSDGVIGNLETTLTDSNEKYPNKVFNYRLSPKYASTLNIANIKYVSLANNHILDYSQQGMLDTVTTLNQLSIKYSGIGYLGNEPLSANRPTIMTINGQTFAFFSMADHYVYWRATNNHMGIWYINLQTENNSTWNQIKEAISKIKDQVNYIIVSLHWGPNYVDQINPIFIKFAHFLIELGVHIIHGTSPHHVLPYEHYKQGIIFYSLGDFIDDYAIDTKYRNDLAFMVKIKFKNGQVYLDELIPTKISNYQVNKISYNYDYNFIQNIIITNSSYHK